MRTLILLAACTGLSSVAAGQILHALLPGTPPLRYGTFDAETGTWLDIDTLAFTDGFISGSGTWDHWAGHYLFAGFSLESTSATLWSWDGLENTIVHAPDLAGDIGALHQDLSTALFYGLGSAIVDSSFVNLGGGFGYWDYSFELHVRSVDPATGAVTDVVSLPFLTGYYSGSSTFDSDAHRYHLLGVDALGSTRLVTVDVAAQAVIASPPTAPALALHELEAGLDADRVWALRAPGAAGDSWAWVELNLITGAATELAALPGIDGFIGDASALDQTTGRYAFAYIDALSDGRLRVIDAATGSTVADHLLDVSVAELHADNRVFAVAAYGIPSSVAPTATAPVSPAAFPNPTATSVTCSSSVAGRLAVVDCAGSEVLACEVPVGPHRVDFATLPSGLYVLCLPDGSRQRVQVLR
jgi:hypothetical protein